MIGLTALFAGSLLSGCAAPSVSEMVTAGISEFQLGRLDKAKGTLEQALGLDPANPDALFYLGRIYQARGDYVRAVYYYQCALDVSPGYPEVGKYLAEAQEKAGTAGKMLRFIPEPSE